jgi:hypothetical protein
MEKENKRKNKKKKKKGIRRPSSLFIPNSGSTALTQHSPCRRQAI